MRKVQARSHLFLTLKFCTDKGNETWYVCVCVCVCVCVYIYMCVCVCVCVCFMLQALPRPMFTHCCMCDSSIWLALLGDNGYGMLDTQLYGTEQYTALHTVNVQCNSHYRCSYSSCMDIQNVTATNDKHWTCHYNFLFCSETLFTVTYGSCAISLTSSHIMTRLWAGQHRHQNLILDTA